MSNPLSLADAVAEIGLRKKVAHDRVVFLAKEDSVPHVAEHMKGFRDGLEFCERTLARVTEVAELRAEIERLNRENEALMMKMGTMIKIPDADTSIPFRKAWENEDGSFEAIVAPGTWEPKLLEETKE